MNLCCVQCKNVTALKMKAEVDQAAVRLLFLLDYAILPGLISLTLVLIFQVAFSFRFIACRKLYTGATSLNCSSAHVQATVQQRTAVSHMSLLGTQKFVLEF